MTDETLRERLTAAAKAVKSKPSPRQQRELEDLYDEGRATIHMGKGSGVTTRPKRWSWSPGGGGDGL
jgi:hypothetical protein